MNKDEQPEFAKQIMILTEIFNDGKPISKELAEIYWQLLSPYSLHEIESAVKTVASFRVYKGFPKPAEIIEAITGKNNQKAMKAWIALDKGVKSVGPYESVRFEDPVVHSVVTFWGGWHAVCLLTEEEWNWKQKEFLDLYPIFATRKEYPGYLVGIHESNNRTEFPKAITEPRLITFDNVRPVPGLPL